MLSSDVSNVGMSIGPKLSEHAQKIPMMGG